MEEELRFVQPGDKIIKASPELQPGVGCYLSRGFLIASKPGPVIKNKNDSGEEISIGNATAPISINIGQKVLARVTRIKTENIFVSIIAINESTLTQPLEGVIKRKDIITKGVDSLLVEECFIPGDIIRAKIGSFGDSKKLQLITTDEDCGVIFARSQLTGQLMLPFSFEEMICPVSETKEKRKVAKPDLNLFKVN